MWTVRNWAKAELLGEFERKAGALEAALRFAEEDAEAAEAKWGWSNGATNGGKSTRLGRGAKMHRGVQAASLPICAKSELAAERKRNGKAKWQSEMAKRNGKAKWQSEIASENRKRNAEQSAPFARPRRSPAKFTRITRIRMLVFAKVQA
jgi:hypothetical protein